MTGQFLTEPCRRGAAAGDDQRAARWHSACPGSQDVTLPGRPLAVYRCDCPCHHTGHHTGQHTAARTPTAATDSVVQVTADALRHGDLLTIGGVPFQVHHVAPQQGQVEVSLATGDRLFLASRPHLTVRRPTTGPGW